MLVVAYGRNPPPEGKCQYLTVYKMPAADCAGLNLVRIPPTTKKLEVLDVSVNRIRILRNDSFVSYSSLRFLYLNDNSITIIEPFTFEPLENLEVLDLKLNAIRDLPTLLPTTLRKLYISDNPLVNIPLSEAGGLTYLDLGNCFLAELPYLGELPNLQELNLSGNPLGNLTVTQIASFCHLETLHLPVELLESLRFSTSCDCVRLRRWTIQHTIIVEPFFNCTISDTDAECANNATGDESRVYNACQLALQQQAVSGWAAMAGGLSLVLLCLVLLAFIWRRRRAGHQPPAHQPHRTADQEVAFRKRKLLEETPKSKF